MVKFVQIPSGEYVCFFSRFLKHRNPLLCSDQPNQLISLSFSSPAGVGCGPNGCDEAGVSCERSASCGGRPVRVSEGFVII